MKKVSALIGVEDAEENIDHVDDGDATDHGMHLYPTPPGGVLQR